MKNKTLGLLLSTLSAMAGAADIPLPETLVVGWTQGPEAMAQMSYCVPGLTREKVEDIQSQARNGTLVHYQRSMGRSSYLLAQGDKFACIDLNGSGKPILPPKLFGKFLKLDGASDQTTAALNTSLATQIATRGVASALIKFPNGNAIDITCMVADDAPVEVIYATNFMKAGEYDEAKYHFVASDQVKSFATVSHGASGRRIIVLLQDEIAPRPLKGDHLLSLGSPKTANYPFEGTTWRFRPGGAISLASGGVLNYVPARGEELHGTWRVEDNALYFNYGKVYGSAMLDKDNNLFVEFRSPPANEKQSERRWTAKLEQN